MALYPISNVKFINQKKEIVEVPLEWEPIAIGFEIPDITNWEEYAFYMNMNQQELSLKKINGQKMLVTDFMRLSAGHYKLTLKLGNEEKIQRLRILPKKISSEAFKTMLEELVYGLPADIAISLNSIAHTGIKLESNQQVTIAQEVVRLKRTWFGTEEKMGLVKMIKAISEKPHRVLQTNELWVKSEEVRRPNISKIGQALVRSQNITASGRLVQVIDNRSEHSFNVYENQLLKLFIHQYKMKLLRLVKFFKLINNKKLIEECEGLLKEYKLVMRKATFLEQVETPIHFQFKTTMVLLNVPSYRAAMKGYLEFQRAITSNIDEPAIDSPLENIPLLYQKWGTLKVISEVLHVAISLGYQLKFQRLEVSVMGGRTIKLLPDGKPVLVLYHPQTETTVKVIPERSYVKRGNPLKSISFTQRPDIAIEVEKKDGVKVFLFDPKYKLDSEEIAENTFSHRPLKVDIDKMHAYRDAIRNLSDVRVVEYAAIMYPGETVIFSEGLQAIRSFPGEETEFKKIIENALQV